MFASPPSRRNRVVYGKVRHTIEPSINAISTIINVGTSLLLYLAD